MEIPTFLANLYDAIHQRGIIEINSGNNFQPVPVTADSMQTNLVVALLIQTDDSRLNKLRADLKALERNGFQFSLAGRDFPTYVTVQVSNKGMKAKSVLEKGNQMIGYLTFNRLVLDRAGNILLMSERIPRQISEWRGWASQVMTEYGGQLKPLLILHSSIASIVRAESMTTEDSERLVELVDTRNRNFHSSPLEVHTESIFVGTLHDLHKSLN